MVFHKKQGSSVWVRSRLSKDLDITAPMNGLDLVVAILEDLIGKGNFGWKKGELH